MMFREVVRGYSEPRHFGRRYRINLGITHRRRKTFYRWKLYLRSSVQSFVSINVRKLFLNFHTSQRKYNMENVNELQIDSTT